MGTFPTSKSLFNNDFQAGNSRGAIRSCLSQLRVGRTTDKGSPTARDPGCVIQGGALKKLRDETWPGHSRSFVSEPQIRSCLREARTTKKNFFKYFTLNRFVTSGQLHQKLFTRGPLFRSWQLSAENKGQKPTAAPIAMEFLQSCHFVGGYSGRWARSTQARGTRPCRITKLFEGIQCASSEQLGSLRT